MISKEALKIGPNIIRSLETPDEVVKSTIRANIEKGIAARKSGEESVGYIFNLLSTNPALVIKENTDPIRTQDLAFEVMTEDYGFDKNAPHEVKNYPLYIWRRCETIYPCNVPGFVFKRYMDYEGARSNPIVNQVYWKIEPGQIPDK